MKISDLLVVAGPRPLEEDEEDEEERWHTEKLSKLRQAESHLQSKTGGPLIFYCGVSLNHTGTPGIWSRFFEKVMDNLQVQVESVHIRYEDNTDPKVYP